MNVHCSFFLMSDLLLLEIDEKGDKVVEGEIGAARLFATIYKALGINPQKNYYVGSRPVPLTDPGTEPVKEVLA